MRKSFIVDEDFNDSRLDRWFKKKVINLPHSLIEKIVRQNKIVKPFEVGMLPEELKSIESSKNRKDLFIKIVLPLILPCRIFSDSIFKKSVLNHSFTAISPNILIEQLESVN